MKAILMAARRIRLDAVQPGRKSKESSAAFDIGIAIEEWALSGSGSGDTERDAALLCALRKIELGG